MNNTLKNFSTFTKAFLIIGVVFVGYGYFSRLIQLYFFWESKSFGWSLIFIGIIGALVDRVKVKKEKKQKSLIEKIGIGLFAFVLFVQVLFMIIIPMTDAYSIATDYLRNDEKLIQEIGEIKGFGLIPSGFIQKSSDPQGESGNAQINLIVKGEKKYKDVTVYVVKTKESTEWKIDKIEFS